MEHFSFVVWHAYTSTSHIYVPVYHICMNQCISYVLFVFMYSMYHLIKMFVCLLAGVHMQHTVSEPTPWISVVGLSRDEQSRIKSIHIQTRQQPLLLMGDVSTEREENKHFSFVPVISPLSLSHSFAPSGSPYFFFLPCLSLIFFSFFYCAVGWCLPSTSYPLQ